MNDFEQILKMKKQEICFHPIFPVRTKILFIDFNKSLETLGADTSKTHFYHDPWNVTVGRRMDVKEAQHQIEIGGEPELNVKLPVFLIEFPFHKKCGMWKCDSQAHLIAAELLSAVEAQRPFLFTGSEIVKVPKHAIDTC